MINICTKCGKVLAHNEPVYIVCGCDVESYFNKFTRDKTYFQILETMCRKCYELSLQEGK
jgi:hypothetical protein